MKSLMISGTYFPPQVGGISRIMERLVVTLGPDRICCLTGTREQGPSDTPPGARVYRAPVIFSDRSKLVRALAWGRTMGTILLRERPRAVLLGDVDDGTYALWLERRLGIPFAIFAHGNEICRVIADPGQHAVAREALRSATRVIAVSRFTAGLVQQAGVEPGRITVAYPGCEVDTFRPQPADPDLRRRLLGAQAGNRIILTTGNLVARKGHDRVLEALPGLLRAVPDVTYLVVGDGPHRAALERLASELGVRDRVVFAGYVGESELPRIYALADVFVMASRQRPEANDVEGFGLVFLEASACGKPVVGGRSGGIPEAVVEGETGLLVDPESPREIAEALRKILTEPGLAAVMGAAGIARARREFNWVAAAERVDAVLRSLPS